MTREVDSKKILVLMSGGVDSSVAAALLHAQGYKITGVYLKLWDQPALNRHPEAKPKDPAHDASTGFFTPLRSIQNDGVELGDPCWAQEMRDAARVAAHLGIPFEVWDVTADYKKRVLENFYSEYAAERTPNPDVLCNSEIKFGVALDRALEMGYEYIATGHYARVHNPSQPPLILRGGDRSQNVPPLKVRGGPGELCQLHVAVDQNKDQSYFLWRLTPKQLARVIFPIGEYTKPQVRAIAHKFALHNAEKKDSQGVCFLGKIRLKEFLYRDAPPLTPPRNSARGGETNRFPPLTEGRLGGVRKSGPIIDVHGALLGLHDGLAHFTIGQRHGVNIGDGHGPYFVVEKDLEANALIVANEIDEPKYRAIRCQVSGVRCQVAIPVEGLKCLARVRYRAPLCEVRIMNHESRVGNNSIIHNSCFIIHFKEPQRAVAPGQSIVFYDGDRVIGGGIIDAVRLINQPYRNSKSEARNPKQYQMTKILNKFETLEF